MIYRGYEILANANTNSTWDINDNGELTTYVDEGDAILTEYIINTDGELEGQWWTELDEVKSAIDEVAK